MIKLSCVVLFTCGSELRELSSELRELSTKFRTFFCIKMYEIYSTLSEPFESSKCVLIFIYKFTICANNF